MSLFVFLRFLFTFAFLKMNVKLSVLSVHLSLKKKKNGTNMNHFTAHCAWRGCSLIYMKKYYWSDHHLLKKKEVFEINLCHPVRSTCSVSRFITVRFRHFDDTRRLLYSWVWNIPCFVVRTCDRQPVAVTSCQFCVGAHAKLLETNFLFAIFTSREP